MHVYNAVHDIGAQPLGKTFIAFDFAFCVVLKMSIAFVSAFHKTTELGFKGIVFKEVVYSEART